MFNKFPVTHTDARTNNRGGVSRNICVCSAQVRGGKRVGDVVVGCWSEGVSHAVGKMNCWPREGRGNTAARY